MANHIETYPHMLYSLHVENLSLIAIAIIFVVVLGGGTRTDRPNVTNAYITDPIRLSQRSAHQEQFKQVDVSNVLTDAEALRYRNYLARKRYKGLRYPETSARPVWARVSYVVLERDHRVLMTFDDRYYFGMAGNSTSFGLFSFLGGDSKQLIVSQDVNRGGAQWIAKLSQSPRIIFNSSKWGVGREVNDMGIIDLDNDGVFEITAPICDFYDLQDKMSMSQIPLPTIVLKYDPEKEKYLPANPLFQDYLIEGTTDFENVGTGDEFNHRSIVLGRVLDLIYAGKQRDAWKYFERAYKLNDKVDIKRRVKSILARQPVYNFIYNHGKKY